MKKTILTIAFTILTFITFAQGPQLGVQASPLLSIMSYDGESINGIGYSAGLSCKIPLSERWSIRPEFNIQQRSGSLDSDYTESSDYYTAEELSTYTMKYSVVDVPVLFEYRTKSKLGFYVGPQFGASFGSSYKWKYSYTAKDLETGEEYSEEGTETEDGMDSNFNEFSFALGTNYNLDNGLSFEFRFQQSAGVLYTYDGDFDTDMSFAGVQLGCRYTIPSGR